MIASYDVNFEGLNARLDYLLDALPYYFLVHTIETLGNAATPRQELRKYSCRGSV